MCLETCVERHGRQRFGHSPFPNPFPSAAPVVLSTTARVRVRVRGFPKAGSFFFFFFLFWQIYFTAFRELSFLSLARTLAVCICQEAVATLCSEYSLLLPWVLQKTFPRANFSVQWTWHADTVISPRKITSWLARVSLHPFCRNREFSDLEWLTSTSPPLCFRSVVTFLFWSPLSACAVQSHLTCVNTLFGYPNVHSSES